MRKEAQKREDVKKNARKANENCNDYKFQIHCNELEWVNPKGRNMKINNFCTSLCKFYTKDEIIRCHWVGHSKM